MQAVEMVVLVIGVICLLVGQGESGKERQMDGTVCEDEYIDCGDRAEQCEAGGGGADYEQLLGMLTSCRETCRQYYSGREVADEVEYLGGLNDTVRDVFGEEIPICDEKEGVNSVFRYSLLRHRLATLAQPAWVPSFTERGFVVEDLPNVMLGMLNVARMQKSKEAKEEQCVADISCFNCQDLVEDKKECKVPRHSKKQLIMPLTPQLKDTLMEALHPIAEAWAGMRLLGSSVYGIRRYTRGAWLATHLDQLSTHVISAIINVGQKGKPWPLYIKDHGGETHKIYLEPGQLLWYESARLPHGRPEPFEGEFYDNVFVHFKPASKQWHRGKVVFWERGDTPQWRVRVETDKKGRKNIIREK